MSDPRSALLTALEGLHQIAKYYSLLPDIKLETEMRSFYVHLWARCLELYNQIATMLNFEPRSEFLETFSSLLESLIDVDRLRSHGKLIEVAAPYSGFGALRHIINTERNQEDQVQFLQDCIDFRAGEKRATLLNLLKGGIVGLKTQTYDFILEEDVPFHTRARPKPPDKIHPAASSLFQVLESRKRCSCHLPHEYVVQLCLETHRSNYDFDTDSNFEFNCAFNFGCGFNLSIGLREMLHEAQVQTIIPLSSNEDSAESSQSRHPPVKKLCGVIKVAMGSNYRLRFHSENGNLWRLCSEESSSKIDRSKPPISLTQIMVKNPKALTEKTKRVLSVLLGHAVFHLHETPWLQSPWSLSNVMFFETSSGLPLRPYIRARPNAGPSGGLGGHAETDEDDEFNPDANILPPCPCLVDLAIALMELYKAESIDSLAGTYGISAISQTDPKLRYASVREVFKCCQTDIADQTREAIRSCLAPGIREDDHGKELNDLELRSVIYQRIVRRLEDELQTGFSDLSIEKLDESAQNMDLNKGGQPICKEQANQSFHKSVSASKLEQQTSDKPSGRRVRFARDDDENLHQGRSSTLAEQSKSSSQRDKGLCHNNLLSVNGCIEQGSVASTRGRLHTRPNTIRVSNIPHDISEPQLAAKLRSFFGSECKVHSLARASRDTYWWNCATVTFPSIPNQDLDSLIEKEKHRPRDLSKRILYDTHFLGITALYDAGEKATIDIIAIEGLGTNPFGTFRAPNGGEMWLRDYIPESFPVCRVLLYGYDSKVRDSESNRSVQEIAGTCKSDILRFRELTETEDRPVIWIGQSMGGLIIQEVLCQSRQLPSFGWPKNLLTSSIGFLSYGVPSNGLKNESLLEYVRGKPNFEMINSICTKDGRPSDYLENLAYRFSLYKNSKLRIHNFLEANPSHDRINTQGPTQRNVEDPRAIDRDNCTWLTRNHSELVKFDGRTDEAYMKTAELISLMIKDLGFPN